MCETRKGSVDFVTSIRLALKEYFGNETVGKYLPVYDYIITIIILIIIYYLFIRKNNKPTDQIRVREFTVYKYNND